MEPRKPDSICERLGDLAASATPEKDRLPDATGWAHISRRLDRRSLWWLPRRLIPVLALSAVLVVTLAGYFVARRPLGYRVQGCTALQGAALCTSAGSIAFSDGTLVSLDPGASLSISPQAFGRGAELAMDDGDANLSVVHRTNARWAVLAGPFRAEVTGTRFSVRWSKLRQVLDVAVTEGEVRVSGGSLVKTAILRAGQSLRTDATGKGPAPDDASHPSELARAAASARQDAVAIATPDAAPASPSLRSPALAAKPAAPSPRRRAQAKVDPPAAPTQSAEHAEAHHTDGVVPGLDSARARTVDATTSAGSTSAPPSSAPAPEPSWASAHSLGLSSPTPAPVVRPSPAEVVLAADGQLQGGMTGQAWLAWGEGTKLSAPVSHDNHTRLRPSEGGLCTSGTVARLRCVNENTTHARCNWDKNWGVAIGLHVKRGDDAWGDDAARGIAVDFHGRSAKYRLNAHRKGDPQTKNHCIENYKSGQMVTPAMFKTRCWEGQGEALADFKDIDLFNLEFSSGMEYVAFHYCVSAVRLAR
jgi:hypothetical protein